MARKTTTPEADELSEVDVTVNGQPVEGTIEETDDRTPEEIAAEADAIEQDDRAAEDADLEAEATAAGMTVDAYRKVLAGQDPETPTPVTGSPDEPPLVSPEDRTETYEAVRPNGERVQVWRNIDTGEHRVTPIKDGDA